MKFLNILTIVSMLAAMITCYLFDRENDLLTKMAYGFVTIYFFITTVTGCIINVILMSHDSIKKELEKK